MSLASWLAELVRPCVHMDKQVAIMFDDKENPKVTTIVNQCEICGRVAKVVNEAEGVCRHRWETTQKVSVFESPSSPRPYAFRVMQECKRCGDVRGVLIMGGGEK